MNIKQLNKYLETQIPILKSMGVKVIQASKSSIEVKAPVQSNRNHLGTAFGGSLYSVSVLACYSWLFNFLESKRSQCHVVIKSGQMKYLKPVPADFTSICSAPSVEAYNKFYLVFESKKRSKILLSSKIKFNEQEHIKIFI